jgi:hypothetical protein
MSRLELVINRGSTLQLYEAIWGPVYEAVLNILGSSGVVLPLGDPKHGQPGASTFTTVGEEQVTFTWSEAPNAFDSRLDLTDPASFQGVVPVVSFNGTDEEADSPDATYWPSGAGFSLGFWVNATDNLTADLLAKWETNQREFYFSFDSSGLPTFGVYDETNNALLGRIYSVAGSTGVWELYVCTYGGGTTSASCKIYKDGARVGDGNNESGAGWASVVNGTSAVDLMYRDGARYFGGKVAGGPLGPFFVQKELTADEALRLFELGRRALGL